MSVRIFRLVTKICVKNILRIFQAHFRENVKNTEPGRKFHHSYKKKRVLGETQHPETVLSTATPREV